MDLTFYIAALLILIIFLVAFIAFQIIRQITNIPIVRATMALRDRSEMPQHLQGAFAEAEQQLQALGFYYSHCQLIDESTDSLSSQRWLLIYRHPQQRCGAVISSSLRLGQGKPYSIEFTAYDCSGKLLSTTNGFAHNLIRGFPDYILIDAYTAKLEQQWQTHRTAMYEHIEQPAIFNPLEAVTISEQFHHRYLNYLHETGWIKALDDKRYRFRIFPGLKYALQIMRGERRVAKLLKQHPQLAETGSIVPVPITADVEAYRRMEAVSQVRSLGWISKTALFIGSVILFCLVFGIAFSWQTVLIILLVLLFHECGHLLAMRWFGYRDLQILFIPALGAVATGKDDHVKVYQKVIVYLLGPIPGLIVGFGLFLFYQQSPSPLLLEITAITLVVNYFNLLPIMPLDGGQTLNILLFALFPRLQALFLLFSVVLLGIGAWYLNAPVLWVLVVLLTVAFFSQWHHANALVQLRKRSRDVVSDDEETRLTKIFGLLRESAYQKLPLAKKFQLAKYLLKNFSAPRAGWSVIVISLAVYLSVLVAPIAVLASYQMLPFGLITTGEEYAYEAPDWEQQLTDAETAEQRWQVLIDAGDWYYDIEDILAAQNYYQRAAQISKTFPANDIRKATVLYKQGLVAEENETARELLQQALQLQQQLLDDKHTDIADTLSAMVWTYDDVKQQRQPLEQALVIYQKADDLVKANQSLRTLAWLSEQNNEKNQAEAYLLKSLAISENAPEYTDFYWANSGLSHLAEFYLRYADYDKAITTLNRLTTLQQQQTQQEHFGFLYSQTLTQLGWSHLLKQDFANAQIYFEQAQQAYKLPHLSDGVDLSGLPLLLDNIYVLLKQHKHEQAQLLFEQLRLMLESSPNMELSDYQQRLQAVVNRQSDINKWPDLRQAAHLEVIEQLSQQSD